MRTAIINAFLALTVAGAHLLFVKVMGFTANDIAHSQGKAVSLYFGIFEGKLITADKTISYPNYPMYVLSVMILFNIWVAIRSRSKKLHSK